MTMKPKESLVEFEQRYFTAARLVDPVGMEMVRLYCALTPTIRDAINKVGG